ncbi:MAG: hypothetical protein Q8K72_04715, partial [Acidimicrobiales bacterium]|nr:hypothetical protein [Acidimicrobiales bacterium]
LLEGRRPPRPPVRQARQVGPEVEALRLAVHRPEEVAELLHEVLFVDPLVLAGYRALCASTTLAQAIDAADEEPATLLRRLAVEDADVSAADVLALLAREAGLRVLGELRKRGVLSDAEVIAWLQRALEDLRDPALGVEATGRLVRWIVDRFEVEA